MLSRYATALSPSWNISNDSTTGKLNVDSDKRNVCWFDTSNGFMHNHPSIADLESDTEFQTWMLDYLKDDTNPDNPTFTCANGVTLTDRLFRKSGPLDTANAPANSITNVSNITPLLPNDLQRLTAAVQGSQTAPVCTNYSYKISTGKVNAVDSNICSMNIVIVEGADNVDATAVVNPPNCVTKSSALTGFCSEETNANSCTANTDKDGNACYWYSNWDNDTHKLDKNNICPSWARRSGRAQCTGDGRTFHTSATFGTGTCRPESDDQYTSTNVGKTLNRKTMTGTLSDDTCTPTVTSNVSYTKTQSTT